MRLAAPIDGLRWLGADLRNDLIQFGDDVFIHFLPYMRIFDGGHGMVMDRIDEYREAPPNRLRRRIPSGEEFVFGARERLFFIGNVAAKRRDFVG